jgi:hypothetical protein
MDKGIIIIIVAILAILYISMQNPIPVMFTLGVNKGIYKIVENYGYALSPPENLVIITIKDTNPVPII